MRWLLILSLLVGCEVAPTDCDPGHAAWVRQVVPLVWGRHPTSAQEVQVLAAEAERVGRAQLVRAMTEAPAYRVAWTDRLYDLLRVNRTGLRSAAGCFGGPRLESETPALAEHVRDHAPGDAPWPDAWSFHDLTTSALLLDDLSVLYRANLFAMLAADKLPVNEEEAAAMSLDRLRVFERVWLQRDLTCLPCHNAEYSVTGTDDPETDRTWEVPGHVEAAVFGDSAGRPKEDVAVYFRRFGVVDRAGFIWGIPDWLPTGGIAPWGMSGFCGAFLAPEDVLPETFGDVGFFIDEGGPTASVWDLEAHLASGFEALSSRGFADEDGAVDGPEAFARLVAMSVAEGVHAAATGSDLTVSHGFPRNRAQRDQLESLAQRWVDSGYSLVELLVAVATQPAFALDLPGVCGTEEEPWSLEPLLDPWTVDAGEGRDNHLGDRIRRHDVRVLIRSMTAALDWGDPPAFLAVATDPQALELAALGVFLKDSAPGSRGIDFQGMLAWEDRFGACENPGWFGGPDTDWIDALVATELDGRPLAVAVKDRLLADGTLDDAEWELVRAVADPAEGREAAARAWCGLWSMTPEFQLAGYPRGPGESPAEPGPGNDADAVCARLSSQVDLACR